MPQIGMVSTALGKPAGILGVRWYEAFGYSFHGDDHWAIVRESEPKSTCGDPAGPILFHWHRNVFSRIERYIPGDWEDVLSAAMSEASTIMRERHRAAITAQRSRVGARWGIDLTGPYQGFAEAEVMAAIDEARGFGWTVSEVEGFPGLWWVGHKERCPVPRERTASEIMGAIEALRARAA